MAAPAKGRVVSKNKNKIKYTISYPRGAIVVSGKILN